MLVLKRKAGEFIRIGDGVTVMVLGTSGNAVRLGVTAPVGVPIHRSGLKRTRPRPGPAAGDSSATG